MGSLPAFVCLYVKRNNRKLTMYVSCCLDNFLLKNLILFIFGKKHISRVHVFENRDMFELFFTFFYAQGKRKKHP